MKKFVLFAFASIVLLSLAVETDAKCGSGSGRIAAFRQARHAARATRHQALADHHAAKFDRIQSRRATVYIQVQPAVPMPQAVPMLPQSKKDCGCQRGASCVCLAAGKRCDCGR